MIDVEGRTVVVEGAAGGIGRSPVQANVITPGAVRTARWDHRIERNPQIAEGIARYGPIARLVEPVEVARAAAFPASPLASAVTLPVDGGILAGNLPLPEQIAG